MKTVAELQSFIGVVPDGKWGHKSQAALNSILHQSLVVENVGEVDERSETNIATLHPMVRNTARRLIIDAKMQGITAKITSGTRTYAEQDALYAKGNVTKARGGYSNHNFGIAFDVTLFADEKPVWESPHYATVGAIGKKLGLSWGGDWKSFRDEPHFELRPDWAESMSESDMLAELRKRRAVGKDSFA